MIPEGLQESIKEAEAALKDLEGQIRNAKAVGTDVRELETEFESQKKQVELIKRVYKF